MNPFQLRELLPEEVNFSLAIEEDEFSLIDGSFATDEPEKDRELVKEIKRRVYAGDTWAWCLAKVVATWKEFNGVAALGCCSYEDEEDFKGEGGYYEDMKSEALADLNSHLQKLFVSFGEIVNETRN